MKNEPKEGGLDRLGEEARWEVLARYIASESDPAETAAVEAWLADDAGRAAVLRTLDAATRSVAFDASPDLDVGAALRSVSARLNEPVVVPIERARRTERRGLRTTMRMAAVLVGVLAGSLIWRSLGTDPVEAPVALAAETWVTPVGRTDAIVLSDGSRIVLGPDSRLVAKVAATAGERVVELAGHALFDVVHDEARPFTVRTGTATIQDLGTTFGVRDEGEAGVHVVVMTGSVRLEATGSSSGGVTLEAGDRGALAADGRVIAERGVVTEADIAWSRGRLVFDDAPLDRVRSDLRRWYGIDVRVTDPALMQRHLTATFEGETADEVLNVIALSLGARVERRGDTAFVVLRPASSVR